MKQAVYIQPMPDGCGLCDVHCDKRDIENMIKPDDCPLKELPAKEQQNPYNFENYQNGWAKGWNDCLEKIGGKE